MDLDSADILQTNEFIQNPKLKSDINNDGITKFKQFYENEMVLKNKSKITESTDLKNVETLFNEAQAKIARAKGKRLLHPNTAARKISRLAKKMNAAKKASETAAKSYFTPMIFLSFTCTK